MLEPTGLKTISVTGAAAAVLPPMWGQQVIWQWHGMAETDEALFNNGKLCHVRYYIPGGCDLDTLTAAVATVLRRHDALRTTLEIDNGELVGQVIAGAGKLAIELYEAEPAKAESVAAEVAAQLSARPWTCREWPLRVSLVTVAGRPDFLVTAYNRLILDVQSMEFVIDELSKVATGRDEELVARWQSGQEARHERSPDGAATSDRALEYWHEELTACPPSMFDFPAPPPDELRFVMAEMKSMSLARAVHLLRKRWRLAGGAIVLAALAVTLGQYTGHDSVVVQMFAGNRTDRNRRQMLGTLLSEGLLHVSLTGLSFAAIARAAAKSTSAANQYAYCDPVGVREVRDRIRRHSGAYLDLAVYYNDMQTGQESIWGSEPDEIDPVDLTADGSGLTAPETWSGWDKAWQAKVTRQDIRLLLTAQHGRDLPLMLFGDTNHVSRDAMRQLLLGMERLLVAAAKSGDVEATDLAHVSGVHQVTRDPSWVRLDPGWLDLAATAELWRKVTGSETSEVRIEDGRLVGYLTQTTEPSFVDVHTQFVTAIGDRTDLRAPACYRWVAGPPANPDHEDAWPALSRLSESDGRS